MRPLPHVAPGPLDRLLGAVHDQRLGFPPRDLWLAPNREGGLGERLDPLDRAADHAAVDAIEDANERLRDVAAVVHQQDQQIVLQPVDLPRTSSLRLAALRRVPRRVKLLDHVLKRGGADPSQAPEARALAEPGGGEQTDHGAGSFTV